MGNAEKYIKNVYLVEGDNFRFLFTATTYGERWSGPEYVVFMDCQTQRRYTGLLSPTGRIAVLSIPGTSVKLSIKMDSPFLSNGRG